MLYLGRRPLLTNLVTDFCKFSLKFRFLFLSHNSSVISTTCSKTPALFFQTSDNRWRRSKRLVNADEIVNAELERPPLVPQILGTLQHTPKRNGINLLTQRASLTRVGNGSFWRFNFPKFPCPRLRYRPVIVPSEHRWTWSNICGSVMTFDHLCYDR